jgi:microcystin-dependent protein
MTSLSRNYFTLAAHQKPTVGDTKLSLAGVDHLGWMLCDGRSLNTTTYNLLFSVIGYSFGGNGSMFNLPNPAGRVTGIIGSGAGLTTRAMGANVGTETHTLTIAEMPTHNHTGSTNSSTTGITTNASTSNGAVAAGEYGIVQRSTSGANVTTAGVDSNNSGDEPNIKDAPIGLRITDPGHTHSFTTANTGGSNAHNNMQPTLFLGNVYIYCGKSTFGANPYTSVTPLNSTTLIL